MDSAERESIKKRILEKARDQGADAVMCLDRDQLLEKMTDEQLHSTAEQVLDPSNSTAIKSIDEKCSEYRIYPDDVGPAKDSI